MKSKEKEKFLELLTDYNNGVLYDCDPKRCNGTRDVELIAFIDTLIEKRVEEALNPSADVQCQCSEPHDRVVSSRVDPYAEDIGGKTIYRSFCDVCYQNFCDDI